MESKRGRGRPAGSTNKPKTENTAASGEARIAKRSDDILDVLLDAVVLNRDTKVARYLIDRVFGKPTERSEVTTKGDQRITVEYVDDWRNQ